MVFLFRINSNDNLIKKTLKKLKIKQALELQTLCEKHEQEIAQLKAQIASGSN